MQRFSKPFLYIAVVLVILAITTVLILLRNNTSFLNFTPSDQEISENNENNEVVQPDDFTSLIPTTLLANSALLPEAASLEGSIVNLPEGFEISVYAADLGAARAFQIDQDGNIYITDVKGGRVNLVRDLDKDGVGEKNILIDQGLRNPHGIELYNGDLYVATEESVIVYRNITTDGEFSEKEALITGLPTGGHSTRTVRIGPDEKIYLSVGSSCNVCEEEDERRAAISRYSIDGKFEKVYAEGLRNTVGFLFRLNPDTLAYQIWGVDNGRDLIGDNIPPEELNIIEENQHYGWPYCYGDQIANPEYPEKQPFCKEKSSLPKYSMQAHSAPLGLAFMKNSSEKAAFPNALRQSVFVAFHGSWNRSTPTGYKVVRIDTNAEKYEVQDFATGWLDTDGEVWGRPVHVDFDSQNTMFLSDDSAGVIYKISYRLE